MNVYRTEYDHHIITKDTKGNLCCYEGYSLCLKKVQKMIDNNDFTEIEGCTSHDAIAFGYV